MRTVVDGEPGWQTAQREALRLLRRARRRPVLVAGLTALTVAATVGMAARRPSRQRVTVVVRLTETDAMSSRLTWTDRALRGYVNEVVFSQRALLDLMDRHRLFRGDGAKLDAATKAALLRERLTVEVVQNHVISLIPPAERPRSAHVRITYEDADPVRGLAIAIDLGDMVVATGQGQRRQESRATLQRITVEAEEARATMDRLRADAASPRARPTTAGEAHAHLSSVGAAMKSAEVRLDRAEEARVAAETRLQGGSAAAAGLEAVRLEPAAPQAPLARGRMLTITGIAASVCALPLVGLLLGAFDRRIYEGADLRHIGMRYLGRVTLPRARRPARGPN